MSINIGGNILNYKTNEKKYIITFYSDYNPHLNTYIETIFDNIFPHYSSRKLMYSNVCGANAEFICKNLHIDGITLGKIIIINWIAPNVDNLKSIENVYGPIGGTIGMHYHALAYLEITIEEQKYYIAIETTSCEPYKLQFYVGNSNEDLAEIIKSRYQCKEFKISFECDKSWLDIAYSGGKKIKTKMKNKKIKNKKTKKRRFK
jgi:hypothetical protein